MTQSLLEGTITILFMPRHVGIAEPQRLFAVRAEGSPKETAD